MHTYDVHYGVILCAKSYKFLELTIAAGTASPVGSAAIGLNYKQLKR